MSERIGWLIGELRSELEKQTSLWWEKRQPEPCGKRKIWPNRCAVCGVKRRLNKFGTNYMERYGIRVGDKMDGEIIIGYYSYCSGDCRAEIECVVKNNLAKMEEMWKLITRARGVLREARAWEKLQRRGLSNSPHSRLRPTSNISA